MTEQKRKYSRWTKPMTILFCLANEAKPSWDQSTVDNISAGGVKFMCSSLVNLKDKVIKVRVKFPDLAPEILDFEALVVDFKPRSNVKFSDVRAKFTNITNTQKQQLLVLEKIIDSKVPKN